jgi:hypothetical protein
MDPNLRRRNARVIRIDRGRKPGADLNHPADHPVIHRNNNVRLGMVCCCECVDYCLHRRMLLVADMRQPGLGPVKRRRGRVDGHCNAHALHLAEGVEAEIVRAASYDLAGRGYRPRGKGLVTLPMERRMPLSGFRAGMCLIESTLKIGAPCFEALWTYWGTTKAMA